MKKKILSFILITFMIASISNAAVVKDGKREETFNNIVTSVLAVTGNGTIGGSLAVTGAASAGSMLVETSGAAKLDLNDTAGLRFRIYSENGIGLSFLDVTNAALRMLIGPTGDVNIYEKLTVAKKLTVSSGGADISGTLTTGGSVDTTGQLIVGSRGGLDEDVITERFDIATGGVKGLLTVNDIVGPSDIFRQDLLFDGTTMSLSFNSLYNTTDGYNSFEILKLSGDKSATFGGTLTTADKLTVSSGGLDVTGTITTSTGATGSFTTVDGKTVTVISGIITAIVTP